MYRNVLWYWSDRGPLPLLGPLKNGRPPGLDCVEHAQISAMKTAFDVTTSGKRREPESFIALLLHFLA
jgi:hypothetical protein